MKKCFYSKKIAPYVFICPFVITVLLFWLVPICNGVLLSFQDVLKNKWVGFDNYSRLLTDKVFRRALWNSFKYMTGTLVLLIPFPLLFATMLFYTGSYLSCCCRYYLPVDVWRVRNLSFQSGTCSVRSESGQMVKGGRHQLLRPSSFGLLEMDRCEYLIFSGRFTEYTYRSI